MRLFRSYVHILKILRWSYTVPALCYVLFLLMTWMLTIPLRPKISYSDGFAASRFLEDTFEVRIKNSNFNSDRVNGDVPQKNEYLVNVNNAENSQKGQVQILTEVFKQADRDRSSKLDSKELSQWIRIKIVQHISDAVGNNHRLFELIDNNPRNGVVTWREYHSHFLKKRGFAEKYVKAHDEKRHRGLRRAVKEQIMKDRALWTEAAKTNPDSLTAEEFLAFTHPESSLANQLSLVDELYDKFDKDGDEFLTENEFAIFQTEGLGDETMVIRQDEQQRRHEFRTAIDLNGDGKADRRELLHYVAPQSPRHADHEAEALLALADTDRDNMLSLGEILAHPDLFLKSKMVDTARSFHDEF
ncbi:45 kDa calcium-binding protein [Euwallacea similis]|uniref:45 kDa calcium-binding protein n=1 Tax=Euwallacea similis TaxID=1736056 RepID=UPI00344B8272